MAPSTDQPPLSLSLSLSGCPPVYISCTASACCWRRTGNRGWCFTWPVGGATENCNSLILAQKKAFFMDIRISRLTTTPQTLSVLPIISLLFFSSSSSSSSSGRSWMLTLLPPFAFVRKVSENFTCLWKSLKTSLPVTNFDLFHTNFLGFYFFGCFFLGGGLFWEVGPEHQQVACDIRQTWMKWSDVWKEVMSLTRRTRETWTQIKVCSTGSDWVWFKAVGVNVLNHFRVNCSSLLTPPSADITSGWISLSCEPESDLYGSSVRM